MFNITTIGEKKITFKKEDWYGYIKGKIDFPLKENEKSILEEMVHSKSSIK